MESIGKMACLSCCALLLASSLLVRATSDLAQHPDRAVLPVNEPSGADRQPVQQLMSFEHGIRLDGESGGGGGMFALELGRSNRRARRNLEGMLQFEDTPLFPGYGTHFAYVYVGTPPQRVSVIVDTGSHFTAFPCSNCDHCGDHTDPYWDFSQSSSAHVLSCSECQSGFRCNGMTQNSGQCTFSQSYSEGSSWSAFQVTDMLWVGDNTLAMSPDSDKSYSLNFMFGCISTQTGLFKTQLADGIMGMSANEYTLVWQLVDKKLLPSRVFSLCFEEGGGTMVIGGSDDRLNLPGQSMAYVPMTKTTGWFTVEVLDVRISGRSIGVNPSVFNRGKGAIVDSGTTDTYLPSDCASAFRNLWHSVTGHDYSNNAMSFSEEQMLALPTITFQLANGVSVDVRAEAYMEYSGNNQYTPRVYLNEGSGAVLGANFMRDHNVVFDHGNQRVGFAPADCDYGDLRSRYPLQTKSPTTTPAPTAATTTGAPATTPPEAHPDATPAAEVCVYGPYQLVKPCDAKCLLGAAAESVVNGTEHWVQHATTAQAGGVNCPESADQVRPCSKTCPKGAPNPTVVAGGGAQGCDMLSTWSACSRDCLQTRSRPRGDSAGAATDCVQEERDCHTGHECPAAHMGLIVEGMAEVYVKESLEWTPLMTDALVSELASLLGEAPGDVEIGTTTAGVKTVGTASERFYEMSLQIHITPVASEKEAMRVKLALTGGKLSRQLASALQNDPLRVFRGYTVTSTAVMGVNIINASDGKNYQVLGDYSGMVGDERQRTTGSTIAAAVFIVIGLLMVGGALCYARRRKGEAGRKGAYQAVGQQQRPSGLARPGSRDEAEVEMGLRSTDEELERAHTGGSLNGSRHRISSGDGKAVAGNGARLSGSRHNGSPTDTTSLNSTRAYL